MRLFLLAAVLLTACSTLGVEGPPGPAGKPGAVGPQGPPGIPAASSGDRLEALCVGGGDGSWGCAGFRDTARGGEICEYREVDGEIRCTPAWGEAYGVPSMMFADDACAGPTARAETYGGFPCVHWSAGARYCVDKTQPLAVVFYVNPSSQLCELWTLTNEQWFVWPEVTLADFEAGAEWP